MNKTIIIYFSFTGNTEKLAHLAGDFLKEKGKTIDYFKLSADQVGSFLKNCRDAFTKKIIKIKELPDLSGYDLVFLGSPIWAWNVTPAMRALLEQVSLADKKVFIVATHGGGPGKAMTVVAKRPLLKTVLKRNIKKLQGELHEEELLERERDERYWRPLKKELEMLRHSAR